MTTQLREKIAVKNGLTKEHVMIGAGSSDILGTIAQYTALQKGKIVMADLTFRIWTRAARQMGINVTFVPITAEKKQDLPKMFSSIDTDTKLVYVCNPNNPTGTILANAELKNFIEEVTKTRVVLLDEAYLEYTNEPSFCSLVSNNKNLIVLKTFSKLYGMAGARIGYALAHPEMITKLVDLQPWAHAGASAVAIAGAAASLGDEKFIADTIHLNTAARSFTIEELARLNIYTIPSYTNFIYFSIKNYSKDYLALLTANNIVGGRMVEEEGRWSRITIGTMDEMKAYIKAIQ
jgi:histidinol-phosphate aminotransferase